MASGGSWIKANKGKLIAGGLAAAGAYYLYNKGKEQTVQPVPVGY